MFLLAGAGSLSSAFQAAVSSNKESSSDSRRFTRNAFSSPVQSVESKPATNIAVSVCKLVELAAAEAALPLDSTKMSENISSMMFTRDASSFALYARSEEHTSELQSRPHLVCRLLL